MRTQKQGLDKQALEISFGIKTPGSRNIKP